MLVLPNGNIFVCTPRTASRAIMEAIVRIYPDTLNTYPEQHHIAAADVPREGKIFGSIRDPFTHLVSWYNTTYAPKNKTFQDFLDHYDSIRFMPRVPYANGLRLNMYGHIITDFLIYERGPEEALRKMNVSFDRVELVGNTCTRPLLYENGCYLEQIEREFAKDLSLYRRVLHDE